MFIKTDRDQLFNYLEDTSNIRGDASILYIPQTKDEVIYSILECRKKDIPFTISAGRTGTTGGCVPCEGGIISFENLNKIIDINKEKQTVRLEGGVSLENLEKEVNKYDLTLRASPTESLAFISGAVSTSASGVRGFGYGAIRNYVIEIEVCFTTGETLNIKRGEIISKGRYFDFESKGRRFKFNVPSYIMPEVKSQAGYYVRDNMDLIDLFIGSEGTLGVILSCEILLQKIPYNVFDGLVFFSKQKDALSFIDEVKRLKRQNTLFPASLEFFGGNSLRMLKQEYSFVPSSEAAVYFEQEMEDENDYNYLIEKWQCLIERSGAYSDNSILADTPKERERVFQFRHKLPQMVNEFLRQNAQVKVAADISVPWQKFNEMYDLYITAAEKSGIDYVNFGHIGESHLHFNFLPKNEQENYQAREYIKMFCGKAVSLGGTVSAEHGIGKIKKPYLKIMYNENEIKGMAALKKYFDPYCLLGLDNIFDKELLYKI